MYHPLFEMLENADIIRNNRVNINKVKNLSVEKIFDYATQSTILTSADELPREKTIFAQSASISLSGGPWPCQNLNCRLTNAMQLAQLAAFYSDRIYIRNYFANYIAHSGKNLSLNEDSIRESFANDLIVLLYLRPLIEAGVVVPITPAQYCVHCLTTGSFGPDAEERYKVAFKELLDRYSKEITATVSVEGGKYHISVSGPNDLLEHGEMHLFGDSQIPYFQKYEKFSSMLSTNQKVVLSPTDIKKLKISSFFADSVAQNILFELATSQAANTTFVTERSLDIGFIKSLSGNPNIEERNRIIQEYLTCLVPFIENVKPGDLITLREKEQESFILFRDGFTKAIEEYRNQKIMFTTRDAQELYSEFVQPQMARLDMVIKSAQRNLVKGTGIKVLSLAGAISFGLYAGFLPSSVIAMATALGLTKIISDLTFDILKNSQIEDNIRNEGMYFLWKVKGLSK